MVKINGKEYGIGGEKLLKFIEKQGYDLTRIVIEYNGDILPKSKWGDIVLADGDSVEIVSFVGGG